MPYLFVVYILAAFFSGLGINRIAKANRLIDEAQEAYLNRDYSLALVKWQYLQNAYHHSENNLLLNIAHCYFLEKKNKQAKTHYQPFEKAQNAYVRSVAFQQLGVIACRERNLDEALIHFKNALLANPNNEDARYNFELICRLRLQQAKNQADSTENAQPPSLLPPPPSPDEPAGAEPRNKNEKPDLSPDGVNTKVQERLKQMNVSEEKARMILDAMKNNETQFIQQRRRKSTKKVDRNLPDW